MYLSIYQNSRHITILTIMRKYGNEVKETSQGRHQN